MTDAGYKASEEYVRGTGGSRWGRSRILLVGVLGALVMLAVGVIFSAYAAGQGADPVEGESFTHPPGTKVVQGSQYSGGKALKITSGQALPTKRVTITETSNVLVRARAGQKGGSPTLTIRVDGSNAGMRKITSNVLSNYLYSGIILELGTYTIGLKGGNLAEGRYVFVDVLRFPTVTSPNNPPVGVDDSATVEEDSDPTPIDVLANDTDGDGDPLTIASVSNPAHGTAVVESGKVNYTPAENYHGPDSFSYTVSDGNGGTDTATVSITAESANDTPVAEDDEATTDEDKAVTIDVLANDTDVDGATLTIVDGSLSNPAHGTAVVESGKVNYTPAENYHGPDEFTYEVSDGNGGTDTATVSITVNSVDDPPVAEDDSATTPEDTAVTIDVLANDTDGGDGGTMTVESVTQPANGTVTITGGGSGLTYEPDPNYCNDGSPTDDFTYKLNGGSEAKVSVTVTCVEDNPVAVNDNKTVAEDDPATTIDVLANDTDPDGGTMTIESVTQPQNGTVEITNSGSDLTYTPDENYCNGGSPTDEFTYTLNGGSTATVAVTVTCVEDDPLAVNDSATKAEDSGATAIDVLNNDTDVDGGSKTIDSVTQPTNGTVVITNGGNDLTYEPDANYCNDQPGTGPDTFTYTLSPGTSTATVSMKVTCVNDNPVATDESFNGTSRAIGNTSLVVNDPSDGALDPNGPQKTVSGDILSNDTDVDGPGPLAVQAVSNKATTDGGSVTIEADGDFTFHPKAGTSCTDHTDSFDYTLTDQNTPTAGTDTGTVTIDIQDCVWYVDSSLGTNGDGRSHSPFNSLTGINNSATDPDADNQKIFLYDGTYSGGLTLENGQTLFSQRHGLVVPDGGSGNVTLETAVPAGPNTTITGGLTLGQNNTIQGIHLGNATGPALSGTSVGTTTMNTQTSGAINNTSGGAISITTGTLNMAFTSVSSSGGTNNVLLSGVGTSGTLDLGSGTLSGATSDAFKVSGGSGSFSYSGTISNTSTLAANIENKIGGTVTLSGDINPNTAAKGISVSGNNTGTNAITFSGANKKFNTGTGTGVNLSNNTGATISFTNGGLDIDATSGAGFSATGGGTVTVQTGTNANTIDTTTGTALNVANTTIGVSGLTFRSISANGATNGIVLNNTGTAAGNGGLTVTGNGGNCTAADTTCTGGTIQSLVGADNSSFTPVGTGIVLNSTKSPSFTRVHVKNASNYGIRGNQVTGFTLANSLVDGTNGTNVSTPFSEGSISFDTILGTNLITGNEISGGVQRNIRVDHASGVGGGTMTLNITNNNIHDTVGASPDDGIGVEAENTDNYTVNITGNTLSNHGGDHINVTMINSATIAMTISNNTMQNPTSPVRLGGGIFVFGASWNGTGTYTVSNNTILRNRQGGAIHMNKGSGTGTLSGSVTNNTIGTSGVNKSGSIEASGIVIGARGASGTHTTLVEDNNIFGWNDRAIILENGEGSPTLNATVRGNTADTFDPVNGLHGLHADLGILGGDAGSVCLDVGGALAEDRNHLTLAGNEAQGGADIRVRRAQGVNLRMPGYAGGSDDDAAVTSYLSGRNDVTSVLVSSPGTGIYSGGGACPLP